VEPTSRTNGCLLGPLAVSIRYFTDRGRPFQLLGFSFTLMVSPLALRSDTPRDRDQTSGHVAHVMWLTRPIVPIGGVSSEWQPRMDHDKKTTAGLHDVESIGGPDGVQKEPMTPRCGRGERFSSCPVDSSSRRPPRSRQFLTTWRPTHLRSTSGGRMS